MTTAFYLNPREAPPGLNPGVAQLLADNIVTCYNTANLLPKLFNHDEISDMAELHNKHYADLHTRFRDHLTEKGRSPATVLAYAKDIEQLLNFLSSNAITEISQCTLEDLLAFKAMLEKENYTPKSISRKINSTRTFFRFLESIDEIQRNPAERLTHPKFEVKPPRVLSQMEYRALRDVSRVDTRLYSIVELLLQTGIRISELADLKLDDIKSDPKTGIKYLYIAPKNSHPERKVPLNNSAYQAVQEYIKIRPESELDYLFVTKTGQPLLIRNIRTTIDRAFEKAGIKNAKVNDLRNTFIAHHLANGVSLVTVSKLVGHKRLSTTEKYIGLVDGKGNEMQKNLKAL